MTFSCYELSKPIEIGENSPATLVIENSVFYRSLVEDLILQSQGCGARFAVSEGGETLNFTHDIEVITDVFRLMTDSRTVQNRINQAVADEYRLAQDKYDGLLCGINEVAANVAAALDFDASYTPLGDLGGVLKLFGFRMDVDELTLPERLAEYVGFLHACCGRRLFVILNLHTVLNGDELAEFIKLAEYKKIHILFVDGKVGSVGGENVRIIDNDLCEI